MKTRNSTLPCWQLWGARPEERTNSGPPPPPNVYRQGTADPAREKGNRNSFAQSLRAALLALLVLTIVTCGVYPLMVYVVAQVAFPHQANGSLIVAKDGTVRGSELLGQNFTEAKYFHPRPSAAGNGYDAANSGGSNLGPGSQKLNDAIRDRIAAYRAENGLPENEAVPADAVTASGSGLDPHISVRNAELQIGRVAKARNLGEDTVRLLIRQNSDSATWGILGQPGVNVLKLNLALDHQ